MNAQKVKVILEKISYQLPIYEEHKSTLDKDILLGYIRQLYDAVLEDETIVQKALTAPTLFEIREPDEVFFDEKMNQKEEQKPLEIVLEKPATIFVEVEDKPEPEEVTVQALPKIEAVLPEPPNPEPVATSFEEILKASESKTKEPESTLSIAERILSELKGLTKSEISSITETPEIKTIMVESSIEAEPEQAREVNFAEVISKTKIETESSNSENYQFINANIQSFYNEKTEDYGDVASQLANQKINDLREGMAIYQRYEFVQELFKGDNALFDSVIRKINSATNKSDALEIIDVAVGKIEVNTAREEVLKKFVQFIRRKF